MFARSFLSIVSRHGEVQRASLCRNVSTILSKSVTKGTSYKNVNPVQIISVQTLFPYSSVPNKNDQNVTQATKELNNLTRAQKLKKAVADYGSTVIVFHVGISLISLGTCYLLVSSGLDVNEMLINLGLHEWIKGKTTLVSNAGTFAVAYAVHKVFAPVRISITLASVPFIVRYLRKKGILKK